MARKRKGPSELAGAEEFMGADPEKEAIEKIAAAKAAAAKEEEADKAKGHNGGPLMDEAAWRRACNEAVAEDIELERLAEEQAEVRGRLSSIRKVAKSCGVDWDVVKEYRKFQTRIRNGEMGAVVTEQRRLGELMKLMDCPLYTQFSLWPDPPAGSDEAAASVMEAELQGQHAYTEGAKLTDNPFHAATDVDRHNEWRHGWTQAQNANARSMGPNGGEGATH